ncbi:OsmC family protein [Lysobacter sp. CFH 32150]|uniref:OsmC family protein n=1 Tax=Lysobacter sp. CFH 32150 TaxID=2927128 RepID=UPI001FA7FA9A|nr:OsmC family protein [Lysobacter sp. CFH 32150]
MNVTTAGTSQTIDIPAKGSGPGSAVNGGELLMLALATCYCNDLHREAARLEIPIDEIDVVAQGEFAAIGLGATNITYQARVSSSAEASRIAELLRQTDAVAEVHNTLRAGAPVLLQPWSE